MRLRTLPTKFYESVANALPPRVAARLDLLRPGLAYSWGGPMNGQTARQAIVRDIAHSIHFDRVVETGTYRGSTTEFLSHVFRGVRLDTTELSSRYWAYAQRRLQPHTAVSVHLADSRDFLTRMAHKTDTKETVFFYLDAHWEDDLPLRDELTIIAHKWQRAVVMIDDFQVPDDPGYMFDDYGSGKILTESYLPLDTLVGWKVFYPATPSSEESGMRRGCCILSSPALADDVARLPTVRALPESRWGRETMS